MATKLGQFNGALDLLGQTPLASLTENVKARKVLDRVYDESVAYCLSLGLWNFAQRSSEMSNDEDVEPLFGFDYAFSKPTDFVRTISLSDVAFNDRQLEDYVYENGFWYANVDTLYLSYVSNDVTYGLDLSIWPETFALAHQAYLAFKSGLPVTYDKQNRGDMLALHEKWLSKSKVLDAVEQKVGRKPMGRINSARLTRQNDYKGRTNG